MIKNISLLSCSLVLGLAGLASLCLFTGALAFTGLLNIFLIFPLSVFYMYSCFSTRNYKRLFIGLIIVIANIFPILTRYEVTDAEKIFIIQNVFGSKSDIVMYEDMMPWNVFIDSDFRGSLFVFGSIAIGFILIEIAGLCFCKPQIWIPSPNIRTAIKGGILFLINAMNLIMFAAITGVISNHGMPWSYGAFALLFLTVGTLVLTMFVWFKPSWRWWLVMLPSMVIFYSLPFWILGHMNSRGEIESSWNKRYSGLQESTNLHALTNLSNEATSLRSAFLY